MSKIFLTGATGYIGGTVLSLLSSSPHSPPPTISALVRSPSSATSLSKAYPSLRIVPGSLSDTALLESEARAADIVLNLASTSDLPSARAIARGLAHASRGKKGFWVQISGATLLAQGEIKKGRFGFEGGRGFDDVRDVGEVRGVVRANPQRGVDNLVVEMQREIHAALVVGPHIYGTGLGKGGAHTRSVQAPEIARVTLELGEGFRLGEGKNSWSNVHVGDIGELIRLLVGAAIEGKEEDGIWGEDGIYFPENGSMTFGELSEKIAREAHAQGLIPKASVEKVIDAKEADALSGHASVLWGTNAVTKSSRARSLLGWKPSRPSLEDEIAGIVAREAEGQAKL